MNKSTDTLQPGQQTTSTAKPLWAAVGILGAAVLAMGGTMIYQQQRSPTPSVPNAQMAMAAPQGASLRPLNTATANAGDDLVEKPVAAPSKPAPVPAPAKKVVKSPPKPQQEPSQAGMAPSPSPYPSSIPVAAQAPAARVQVCSACGSVESVTPVQRTTKPDGPGLGTVAGGVMGAVLGNQVGQGNGRTAATILGAIGGGFAGNAIEKNVRKETVYQVGVRMEDGSRRNIEVGQPPNVGSRVTVEGSTIRTNDGAVYSAPAPVTQNVSQPASFSAN